MLGKRQIYAKLKNLKMYNYTRKTLNEKPVFITDHLQKKFQNGRKLLLPQHKEANSLNKKTTWKAENCLYVLYIDNVKAKISRY